MPSSGVCPSIMFVNSVETNKISLTFSPSASHIIVVFPYQTFPREPSLRGRRVGINRDSQPISGFIACCERCDRQVLYTQLRGTVASWWHSSLVSGVVCCSRETDAQVFMTRSLKVTPKTIEQNLIVRSGKSEVAITNSKRLRSRYCTVEVNWQKASRGLLKISELLVIKCARLSLSEPRVEARDSMTWLSLAWGLNNERCVRRQIPCK